MVYGVICKALLSLTKSDKGCARLSAGVSGEPRQGAGPERSRTEQITISLSPKALHMLIGTLQWTVLPIGTPRRPVGQTADRRLELGHIDAISPERLFSGPRELVELMAGPARVARTGNI